MGEQNGTQGGWFPPDERRVVSGTPQRSVRWLAPGPLLKLAQEVRRTRQFSALGDKREGQAAFPMQYYVFDDPADARSEGTDGGAFWFDYVADLGDGFDATYAVASCLAADGIDGVQGVEEACRAVGAEPPAGGRLPRGRLLVMGGDEVYPSASDEDYRNRTLLPYGAAWPRDENGPVLPPAQAPYVFALPGNHDWYDELSWFTRFFCQTWRYDTAADRRTDGLVAVRCPQDGPHTATTDWIGGWRTRQSRSYFALKLPHDWWVLAVDTEFERELDVAQKAYFVAVRQLITSKDRVVLCAATPSWLEPGGRGYSNLRWFRDKILGPDVAVPLLLTGDTHHFAHYRSTTTDAVHERHYLTCGGGGAYLSGTHWLSEEVELRTADAQALRKSQAKVPEVPSIPSMPSMEKPEAVGTAPLPVPAATVERIALQTRYPSVEQSRRLVRRWWRIPGRQPSLAWLLGAVVTPVGFASQHGPYLGDHPTAALWLSLTATAVVVLACVGLAAAHRKTSAVRAVGIGALHGLVQQAIAWYGLASVQRVFHEFHADTVGARFGPDRPGTGFVAERLADLGRVGDVAWLVGGYAAIGAVWGLVAAGVLALYLRLAASVRVNTNELFSGLGIADHKSFLRIVVTDQGFAVFPLKIDTVPRHWAVGQAGEPEWVPEQVAVRPQVVDRPIVWPVDLDRAGATSVDVRTTDVRAGA